MQIHMLNRFNTIKNFIKENALKVSVGLLCLFLAVFFFINSQNNKKDTVKTTSPVSDRVVDIVEVTGQVESSKDADLSFDKSGIVNKINVKVGDSVKVGQVIAGLSGGDAYASVREAEAGVQAALATLAQLKSGASDAEISLKNQNLQNAKSDLLNAETQTEDTLVNLKNKLSDIIDYKLSSVFYKDYSQYRLTFNSCDQSIQSQLETERANFLNINIENLTKAKQEVDKMNAFIGTLQRLLSLPCAISDTTLSDKRATVSSIKTDISLMYSEISSRNNAVSVARNAVSRAEKDLAVSLNPDKNKIANQEAFVNQAYARLSQAKAQAGKNVLIAPFSGKISEVNIELGELASQSKYAFKLIADSSYQIKSKISEIDIAKIKIGNIATVTLDAYPNVEFSAVVTSVDPSSKNDSGVPRYGVILTFVNADSRILPGMTSNAKIITQVKEGALTIPASYVEIKSGGGIVRVKISEDKEEERIVKLGIRSEDGRVEILEGLTEKDILIEIAKKGTVSR